MSDEHAPHPWLLDRFNTLAALAVERVTAKWMSVASGVGDMEGAQALLRDIHTLKGDARVMGRIAITEHCHEIEHLLDGAAKPGFIVSAELDIAVQAALSALDALIRLSLGASTSAPDRADKSHTSRVRDLLARHDTAAHGLAQSQGKLIEIRIDIEDAPLLPGLVSALDVAILHAIVNAVDHGIERPDERRAAGKDPVGRISICGKRLDNTVQISIEDDGRGVDWAAVRRRGAALGLLSDDLAITASEDELVELLFFPSFSTRDEITLTSGRGIGLDAMRVALRDSAGARASIRLLSHPGRGTSITILVPAAPSEEPE